MTRGWSALRRLLEAAAADPGSIDRLGFPELIRIGYEQGFVPSEWAHWRTWRETRNIAEAFDESPLPCKVDPVDRQTISHEFAALIDAGMIELA